MSMDSEIQSLWREKIIVEERKRGKTKIGGGSRMILAKAPEDDRRPRRMSGDLEIWRFGEDLNRSSWIS
jgi:hypothetical protein